MGSVHPGVTLRKNMVYTMSILLVLLSTHTHVKMELSVLIQMRVKVSHRLKAQTGSIRTCLLRLEESTVCPALCWSVLEGWKTMMQVLKIASLETGLPGLPLFLLTHLPVRDPKLLFNLVWEGG